MTKYAFVYWFFEVIIPEIILKFLDEKYIAD